MSELYDLNYVESDFPPSKKLGPEISVNLIEGSQLSVQFHLKLFAWTQISELKQMIIDLKKYPTPNLKQIKLFYKNIELNQNQRTLLDYNITDGANIQIKVNGNFDKEDLGIVNGYRIFCETDPLADQLLSNTRQAIRDGKGPLLVADGTSGSYFIENKFGHKISIFKPYDEEVNAPNNPRGYEGTLGSDGICKGILSGQCATREVATYLLDNSSKNYHDVPTTTYIQFYHPSFSSLDSITKNGSLQRFIPNEGIIGDFGTGRFSVGQIHKIGILDIRILNCDRNDGNIIVSGQKSGLKLIPIDHGLSFPDNLQIYEDSIVWMGYSQSKKPFTPQQLEFIESIDPLRDYQVIADKLGFREICLRNFRLSQIFLKKTAKNGLTLYEIGRLLYRRGDEESGQGQSRSKFEEIVLQAQSLYDNILDNQKQNFIIMESDEQGEQFESSLGTNDSEKNLSLALKKKISLPTLKKKTTSYHERKNQERKKNEGINGIKKSIWNKYQKQQWTELFYHYFENILQTFLKEQRLTQQVPPSPRKMQKCTHSL